MKLDENEWSDPQSSVTELREGRIPVVFAFRPTKILQVNPEKLRDWEKLFAKNVGMRPDKALAQRWSDDPKETISGSNDDWDDCDYW